MTSIDWAIIGLYLLGMIALSYFLGKSQKNQEDYFVGGRDLPWWAVGLSTMATQCSAISFISIPAFVALKPDGGLKYLQWELAVPLAMIFIMVFLIPFFRNLNLISVYEYLEQRFGSATRTFLALVFLVSRGLATGVGLYAVAVVIKVMFSIDAVSAIILIGVVTLIYDTIGGMKAVVYSDVVQMVVLLAGIAICCTYCAAEAGGWQAALSGLSEERVVTLDFHHHGLGDGSMYNFWAMVFGGFFLYASYYGCDQSQTQRELSAPTLADTKLSLIFNGLARFPLIALYVLMGVMLAGALASSSRFQEIMQPHLMENRYDFLLPTFILHFVPAGLRAVIFAAILAAAMSSLDSSINSLSASTMKDFVQRFSGMTGSARKFLWVSRGTTVVWGVFAMATAIGLYLLNPGETVVEVINKVGSIFYGPILATFIVGVAVRFVSGPAIISGTIAGVLVNLLLMIFCPGVSWLWWNAVGFVVTAVVSMALSKSVLPLKRQVSPELILLETDVWQGERGWLRWYGLLVLYFVFMVAVAFLLPALMIL